MGFTRKMLSLGTVGLVDFRSDKERTAAYARGSRKHARRQVNTAKKQLRAAQAAARVAPPAAPAAMPVVGPTPIDDLARLAQLHASGALTDAEFAAAKARMLGL